MNFERTADYGLVKQIVTNPRIYPHVSDDGSPSAEAYSPVESDAVWYLLVKDNDELLGCFIFIPQNMACYEVHTCLLPSAWGGRAHDAAIGARHWMFTNSPAQRIVTNVPEDNRLALRFARNAGMEVYGINTKSYLKGGKLLDQVLLGVNKCQ